jgi:hypothetical protein
VLRTFKGHVVHVVFDELLSLINKAHSQQNHARNAEISDIPSGLFVIDGGYGGRFNVAECFRSLLSVHPRSKLGERAPRGRDKLSHFALRHKHCITRHFSASAL